MKKPSNPVLAVVWYAIFGTIVLMCSRSLTSGSQATPKSEDGLSQQEKDLNSRCAEAYLKLAQLNLQTARETNRQVPDTYSAGAILALEDMVAISEAAAREAQRGNGAIWRRVQIRGAEAALEAANATLKRPGDGSCGRRRQYGSRTVRR